MRFLNKAGLVLAIALAHTGPSRAQEKSALTLEAVLALARQRAPAVLAARARVDEARGRLAGASVRQRGNPILEGAAGRRTAEEGDSGEFEIGLTQGLGAAGRRRSRIAAAEADVSGEVAASQEVERRNMLDAAEAFFRVLRARDRLHLWQASHDIAAEVLRTAERRFAAGDVAVLDVHVAGASRAKARSEVLSAEAELERAAGDLRILLGMKSLDSASIVGNMHGQLGHDLPDLVEQAARRPDVRALAARLEQAEAEARFGGTFRRPEIDVGVRYEEEENAQVVLGVLAVSLPVFDRGQGITSEATSRVVRLSMEHGALREAVVMEVETAFSIHQRRLEAADAIALVLPSLEESEALAARSYEAGQISLVDFLLLRRDLLETRVLHLERLFEAAISRVQLEASAGVLR